MPCYVVVKVTAKFDNVNILKQAAKEMGYKVEQNYNTMRFTKGYESMSLTKSGKVWTAESRSEERMKELEQMYTGIKEERNFRNLGWNVTRKKVGTDVKLTITR